MTLVSTEPRVSALAALVDERSRGIVALALASARELLNMDMAYVSAMGDNEQVYLQTDGGLSAGGHDGMAMPADTTICRRVLLGRAPNLIRDTRTELAVDDLMVVQAGLVGAYVGVPITFSDGSVFGTFCCMSDDPNLELEERDVEFLGVLARVVADYLERELLVAQSDASKRDAFARVVHDLRSPLQAIVGYGSLLTQSFQPSHAQTIVAEATRLNEMLNELLDASASPPSVTFDLAEVVREQVPVFLAQSLLHEIEVRIPPEPLPVLGVRERVVRVVSNLLSNAIKYSPQGGPIVVTADSVAGSGRVSVTDRGIGIPELQQPAIFTRFFRVETEATKEIGGTGLGLAFSFEAIRDQGGTMSFTSVEGEGSTFSFELPHATL